MQKYKRIKSEIMLSQIVVLIKVFLFYFLQLHVTFALIPFELWFLADALWSPLHLPLIDFVLLMKPK